MYIYVVSAATATSTSVVGCGDFRCVDKYQRVFVDQSPHVRDEELFGLRFLDVAKLEVWK